MAYPTIDAPYGFKPMNLVGGVPFAGSVRQYSIADGYATNIFTGDPVKVVAAGGIEKDAGTTTLTPVGVFLGCSYTDPNLGYKIFRQYWPASTVATDAVAFVLDHPFAVFKIAVCSSGTTMATLTRAAIGANVSVLSNAGDTATGNSKVAVLSTSAATTSSLPLRVIDVVEETKTSATTFSEVYVMWNFGTHQYLTATGV